MPSAKATYCMIPTAWQSGKNKTIETVKRLVVVRGWGEKGWIGRAEDFKGRETTLYDIINNGYISSYICPNPHSVQ